MTAAAAVVAAAVAVALLALLGFARSFDGFGGDQALFAVGAQKLHAGGVLYRDFWDLKQPGIFVFYLGAGLASGFSQTGIHLVEVVWQCAFGFALFLALRPAVARPSMAALAIVFVPLAYYAGTSGWHLTQVEPLVGLPLFLVAWAAVAAVESRRGRGRAAFLCGLAAGIVAIFKLLLLPVALAIIVAVVFIEPSGLGRSKRLRRSEGFGRIGALGGLDRGEVARLAPWWLLGLAIPIVGFLAYVLAFGITSEVMSTFFTLPSQIVAGGRAPFARLAQSGSWFLHLYGWLAVLAVAGELRMRRWPDAWRRGCYAWLAAGVVAILVQTQSWWEYQFILLLPPLGILATLGVDALIAATAERKLDRRVVVLLPILLIPAAPLARHAIDALLGVVIERPFASAAALDRYRVRESGDYAAALRSAAYLASEPNATSPVFVCGNPLVYVLAHREQSAAINGWALELYPDYWWAKLIGELRVARPADIFLSNDYAPLIATRAPTFDSLLRAEYKRAARLPDGTWYRLKPPV